MMTEIKIGSRWLIRGDLPAVMDIEKYSKYSWSKDTLCLCLRRPSTYGQVAEVNNQVVGFMVFEKVDNRINLIRLGVHPKWQRQGVGSQLVYRLKRYKTIHLHLRETNLVAQIFFRALGFRAIEIQHGMYKTEDGIDMIWSSEK